MPEFLITGAKDCATTLLLAHGAGAGMETPFLEFFARCLPELGMRVTRFEFAFMAARRSTSKRRPPPRAETLMGEYQEAIAALPASTAGRLLIGGKSMGGRVASLVAGELHAAGRIGGLVCLGYPFHPPKAPEKLRTSHLLDLKCPALIMQGENDPFGTRTEVAGYTLSPAIQVQWIAGADHDLSPSRKAREAAWLEAAEAIAAFAAAL